MAGYPVDDKSGGSQSGIAVKLAVDRLRRVGQTVEELPAHEGYWYGGVGLFRAGQPIGLPLLGDLSADLLIDRSHFGSELIELRLDLSLQARCRLDDCGRRDVALAVRDSAQRGSDLKVLLL